MRKMIFIVLSFLMASTHAGVQWTGLDLRTQKEVTLPSSPHRVVVFVSSRCPCSKSHEPVLKALFEEFSSKNIQFVGVNSNINETIEEASLHYSKSSLPFPVIKDHQAEKAVALKAYKTPHVYVFGPSDEILYQGGVDNSHDAKQAKQHYLKNALQAIVKGKKPDPSQTRTLGCVIARP